MAQLDDLTAEIGPRAVLARELLTTVVEHYGLGAVRTARDLGGAFNLNVLLLTDVGSYVARVYRPWMNADRLSLLQQTKRALAQTGIPLANAVRSINGERAIRYGDRWLEVEPFVIHDGIADDWHRYRSAFAMLGGMHSALALMSSSGFFVPPRVSNYGLPHHLLQWIGRTRQQVGEPEQSQPQIAQATAICVDAEWLMFRIQSWWDNVGHNLPAQLTHGDFKGDNLLVRRDGIVAVLDFDFLDRRERIFDLAYFLFWILRRSELRTPESFPWRQVPELLEAYNSSVSVPLTRVEIATLPIEMARVPLYWIAEAWLTDDPIQSVLRRQSDVECAQWLIHHASDLAESFFT